MSSAVVFPRYFRLIFFNKSHERGEGNIKTAIFATELISKKMKKLFSVLAMLALSAGMFAQSDITKFEGIKVDGTKQSMINQLKAKGFTEDASVNTDLLGRVNNRDVFVEVLTNNDKVYRICVIDQNQTNAETAIANYNSLCDKFANDPQYVSLPFNQKLTASTEVLNHLEAGDKQYQAIFFQKSVADNPHNQIEKYKNKPVWFTIYKGSEGYGISVYYDNTYNQDPSKALR